MENTLREESHNLLKRHAKAFVASKIHVRAIALRGDPREELTYKIDHLKPNLVVVGSRGLGTVSRVFLGSVSTHLIHHLPVPVLVVPGTH